jgi:hypothetical protein
MKLQFSADKCHKTLIGTHHDPQLGKTLGIALEMIETGGVRLKPEPPDPVRVPYRKSR